MDASPRPPERPPHEGSRILIAIPAYREADRLPAFLDALAKTLNERFPEARVVVCDDGSGEKEQARLRETIASILLAYPATLLPPIYLTRNRGKGGAILAGWDAHPGFDAYGFIDADGAISPEECARITAQMLASNGRTAFFASRVRMLGRSVERSIWRHISGRLFNLMVALAIERDSHDSQCGFKLVPAQALAEVRPWLRGRQFAFDVELLAFLRAKGFDVVEVPINWSDIPGNKVRFLRDALRMAKAVWIIRREQQRCLSGQPPREGGEDRLQQPGA